MKQPIARVSGGKQSHIEGIVVCHERDGCTTGLAGVLVSDGEYVVSTDSGGRFRLPCVPPHRALFVSTPRGYRSQNSFFQHYDRGKTVEFHLVPAPERAGTRFAFAVLADYQWEPDDTLRAVLSRLIADPTAPQFIAHLGDLFYMMEGAPNQIARRYYEGYRDILSDFDVPVYNLIGNHDQVNGPPVSPAMPEFANGLYEEILGPTYYSFDWGEIHFVVLNPFEIVGKIQHSRFSERQLQWLRNDLAHQPPHKPLILFSHRSPMQCENERDLLDALKEHDVLACFAGDWHRDAVFQCPSEPFPTVVTVGPLENTQWMPPGYRAVSVHGREITHVYRLIHEPNEEVYIVRPAPGSNVSDRVELILTEHLPSDRKPSPAYTISGQTWIPLRAQPVPGNRTTGCTGTWAQWHTSLDLSDVQDRTTVVIRAAESSPSSLHRTLPLNKMSSPIIWRQAVTQSGDPLRRSQPIVMGSLILLGEDTGVRALNARNGHVVWEYEKQAHWLGTPAAAGDCAIVTSWEGDILALNVTDGSVVWHAQQECAIPPSQPCVAQGFVIVGGMKRDGIWDGSLTCLSKATGDVRWSRRYDHPFYSTPLYANGRLWVSGGDVVHCVDVASGQDIWSYHPEHFSLYGHMVLVRQRLIAPDIDGWVYVLDPVSGELLDQYLLPRGTGLVDDGERIYAACGMRGLRAYDLVSFQELWRLHRPGSYFAGRPTPYKTALLAASSDGNIYAVTKESGQVIWHYQFGDVSSARVVFDEERGYFVADNAELIAFSLPLQ